jgi:hypothetical protein
MTATTIPGTNPFPQFLGAELIAYNTTTIF